MVGPGGCQTETGRGSPDCATRSAEVAGFDGGEDVVSDGVELRFDRPASLDVADSIGEALVADHVMQPAGEVAVGGLVIDDLGGRTTLFSGGVAGSGNRVVQITEW